MQEIHSMGGTRFFGGGGGAAAAGGGERRLRPHHHHHSHVQNSNNHPHQQALKCPRCDSLNTKFCYYNNYNLSQPRHFCKNCRRYWTKGGVLRNVPVGGGCRKSKRSNKTKNTNTTATASSSETTTSSQQHQHQHQPPPDQQKSNSHSSSESSSLTAATTAAAAAAVTELNSESSHNNLHESSNLLIPSSNAGLESGTGVGALEQGAGGDCGGIFSEIGTFTSLIASSSSNNDALAFGYGGGVADAASFQWQQHKLPEGLGGSGGSALLDHGHGAVTVDFSAMQGKTGNGGFGPLDWQGGADQGLFDLPNTVDQAYWSHTQWPDQDNSALFHLP